MVFSFLVLLSALPFLVLISLVYANGEGRPPGPGGPPKGFGGPPPGGRPPGLGPPPGFKRPPDKGPKVGEKAPVFKLMSLSGDDEFDSRMFKGLFSSQLQFRPVFLLLWHQVLHRCQWDRYPIPGMRPFDKHQCQQPPLKVLP